MTNGVFTGTIHKSRSTGQYTFNFTSLRQQASATFSPDTISAIDQWLSSTQDWEPAQPPNFASIYFCNETGHIKLITGAGVDSFDPNDDEHLARLVRRLKARAPIPKSVQPYLPLTLPLSEANLPPPAHVQTYLNPTPVRGYKGQACRKSPVRTQAGPTATIEDIDAAFAAFLDNE